MKPGVLQQISDRSRMQDRQDPRGSPRVRSPKGSLSRKPLANIINLAEEPNSPRSSHSLETTTSSGSVLDRSPGVSSVKVFVRLRPFVHIDKVQGQPAPVVEFMDAGVAVVYNAINPHMEREKFSFDACFSSGQEEIYDVVGRKMVDHVFEGYNTCLFAYGQTGSGKTYTMMGDIEISQEKGMIPRLCEDLFYRMGVLKQENPKVACTVQLSYMEIYNERVNDLLDPGSGDHLKVRQHPISGPFVEGLSTFAVTDIESVLKLIERGSRLRTTASTEINDRSSRSHAVCTLVFTQFRIVGEEKGIEQSRSRQSKINLVDLAGSERVRDSGVAGGHFKEATVINLSLTTLGRVIDALVDISLHQKKAIVPPYRESNLTWLLSDSLGGNSKTFIIATISPNPSHLEDTVSTMRYCSRARHICNFAIINEDDHVRVIADLRCKVETLTREVAKYKRQSCTQDSPRKESLMSLERAATQSDTHLLKKIKLLEEQSREDRCELESRHKEIAFLKQHIKTLESNKKHLQTRIQQLQSSSSKDKNGDVEAMTRTWTAKERRLNAQIQQLTTMCEEKDEVMHELKQVGENAREQWMREMADQAEAMRCLQQGKECLGDRIKQLLQENTTLANRIVALEAEAHNVPTTKKDGSVSKSSQTSNERAIQSKPESTEHLQQVNKDVEVLKAKLVDAIDHQKSLTSQVEASEESRKRAESHLLAMERRNAELKVEAEQVRAELTEVMDRNLNQTRTRRRSQEALETQVQRTEEEMASLRASYNTAQEAWQEERAKWRAMEANWREIDEVLVRERAAANEHDAIKSEQITKLKRQHKEAIDKLQRISESKSQEVRNHQQKFDEVSDFKQRILELEMDLHKKSLEAEEVYTAKRRIKSLEDRIKSGELRLLEAQTLYRDLDTEREELVRLWEGLKREKHILEKALHEAIEEVETMKDKSKQKDQGLRQLLIDKEALLSAHDRLEEEALAREEALMNDLMACRDMVKRYQDKEEAMSQRWQQENNILQERVSVLERQAKNEEANRTTNSIAQDETLATLREEKRKLTEKIQGAEMALAESAKALETQEAGVKMLHEELRTLRDYHDTQEANFKEAMKTLEVAIGYNDVPMVQSQTETIVKHVKVVEEWIIKHMEKSAPQMKEEVRELRTIIEQQEGHMKALVNQLEMAKEDARNHRQDNEGIANTDFDALKRDLKQEREQRIKATSMLEREKHRCVELEEAIEIAKHKRRASEAEAEAECGGNEDARQQVKAEVTKRMELQQTLEVERQKRAEAEKGWKAKEGELLSLEHALERMKATTESDMLNLKECEASKRIELEGMVETERLKRKEVEKGWKAKEGELLSLEHALERIKVTIESDMLNLKEREASKRMELEGIVETEKLKRKEVEKGWKAKEEEILRLEHALERMQASKESAMLSLKELEASKRIELEGMVETERLKRKEAEGMRKEASRLMETESAKRQELEETVQIEIEKRKDAESLLHAERQTSDEVRKCLKENQVLINNLKNDIQQNMNSSKDEVKNEIAQASLHRMEEQKLRMEIKRLQAELEERKKKGDIQVSEMVCQHVAELEAMRSKMAQNEADIAKEREILKRLEAGQEKVCKQLEDELEQKRGALQTTENLLKDLEIELEKERWAGTQNRLQLESMKRAQKDLQEELAEERTQSKKRDTGFEDWKHLLNAEVSRAEKAEKELASYKLATQDTIDALNRRLQEETLGRVSIEGQVQETQKEKARLEARLAEERDRERGKLEVGMRESMEKVTELMRNQGTAFKQQMEGEGWKVRFREEEMRAMLLEKEMIEWKEKATHGSMLIKSLEEENESLETRVADMRQEMEKAIEDAFTAREKSANDVGSMKVRVAELEERLGCSERALAEEKAKLRDVMEQVEASKLRHSERDKLLEELQAEKNALGDGLQPQMDSVPGLDHHLMAKLERCALNGKEALYEAHSEMKKWWVAWMEAKMELAQVKSQEESEGQELQKLQASYAVSQSELLAMTRQYDALVLTLDEERKEKVRVADALAAETKLRHEANLQLERSETRREVLEGELEKLQGTNNDALRGLVKGMDEVHNQLLIQLQEKQQIEMDLQRRMDEVGEKAKADLKEWEETKSKLERELLWSNQIAGRLAIEVDEKTEANERLVIELEYGRQAVWNLTFTITDMEARADQAKTRLDQTQAKHKSNGEAMVELERENRCNAEAIQQLEMHVISLAGALGEQNESMARALLMMEEARSIYAIQTEEAQTCTKILADENLQEVLRQEQEAHAKVRRMLEEEIQVKAAALERLSEESRSKAELQRTFEMEKRSIVEILQQDQEAKDQALALLGKERDAKAEVLRLLEAEQKLKANALADMEEAKESVARALLVMEEARNLHAIQMEETQTSAKILGDEKIYHETQKSLRKEQEAHTEVRQMRDRGIQAVTSAPERLSEDTSSKAELQTSFKMERQSTTEALEMLQQEKEAKDQALLLLGEERDAKAAIHDLLEAEKKSKANALADMEEAKKALDTLKIAMAHLEKELYFKTETIDSLEERLHQLNQEVRDNAQKFQASQLESEKKNPVLQEAMQATEVHKQWGDEREKMSTIVKDMAVCRQELLLQREMMARGENLLEEEAMRSRFLQSLLASVHGSMQIVVPSDTFEQKSGPKETRVRFCPNTVSIDDDRSVVNREMEHEVELFVLHESHTRMLKLLEEERAMGALTRRQLADQQRLEWETRNALAQVQYAWDTERALRMHKETACAPVKTPALPVRIVEDFNEMDSVQKEDVKFEFSPPRGESSHQAVSKGKSTEEEMYHDRGNDLIARQQQELLRLMEDCEVLERVCIENGQTVAVQREILSQFCVAVGCEPWHTGRLLYSILSLMGSRAPSQQHGTMAAPIDSISDTTMSSYPEQLDEPKGADIEATVRADDGKSNTAYPTCEVVECTQESGSDQVMVHTTKKLEEDSAPEHVTPSLVAEEYMQQTVDQRDNHPSEHVEDVPRSLEAELAAENMEHAAEPVGGPIDHSAAKRQPPADECYISHPAEGTVWDHPVPDALDCVVESNTASTEAEKADAVDAFENTIGSSHHSHAYSVQHDLNRPMDHLLRPLPSCQAYSYSHETPHCQGTMAYQQSDSIMEASSSGIPLSITPSPIPIISTEEDSRNIRHNLNSSLSVNPSLSTLSGRVHDGSKRQEGSMLYEEGIESDSSAVHGERRTPLWEPKGQRLLCEGEAIEGHAAVHEERRTALSELQSEPQLCVGEAIERNRPGDGNVAMSEMKRKCQEPVRHGREMYSDGTPVPAGYAWHANHSTSVPIRCHSPSASSRGLRASGSASSASRGGCGSYGTPASRHRGDDTGRALSPAVRSPFRMRPTGYDGSPMSRISGRTLSPRHPPRTAEVSGMLRGLGTLASRSLGSRSAIRSPMAAGLHAIWQDTPHVPQHRMPYELSFGGGEEVEIERQHRITHFAGDMSEVEMWESSSRTRIKHVSPYPSMAGYGPSSSRHSPLPKKPG